MLLSTWWDLVRTLVVGVLAYAALVTLLRVSGKRTLSKMNGFDLVVTVALGSSLATVLLSKDIALAQGVLAFAVLIGLQYLVARWSLRSARFRRVIKADPALLYYRGHVLEGALRRERVTEAELRAAVRSQGVASLDAVEAVVLETDGSFAVVHRAAREGRSTLGDVAGQVPRAQPPPS